MTVDDVRKVKLDDADRNTAFPTVLSLYTAGDHDSFPRVCCFQIARKRDSHEVQNRLLCVHIAIIPSPDVSKVKNICRNSRTYLCSTYTY